MASSPDFVAFVVEQVDDTCAPRARPMFGEYGFYSGDTFVGVICDDRLYMKPTEPGRAYIGTVVEAPPYPGAKDYFVIEDGIDDPAWLSELVRITALALTRPAPRKRTTS